jgi:plastocyanin
MNISRSSSLLVGLALLGAACGGPAEQAAPADAQSSAPESNADDDGGKSGGGNDTAVIDVRNIAFKPATMKVLQGTEVTWKSFDEGVRHTATSGQPGERAVPGVQEGSDPKADGMFDGDMPDAGATFSFTFKKAGTYEYFCEVHPSMTASIVVE